MALDTSKSFSETFIVWDNEINLVAALIPSKNGQTAISGIAKFKNGKQLAIFSQPDDYKILHQRLMVACRWIAGLYGTHVVCSRCPAAGAESFAPVNSRVFKHLAKEIDRHRAHKMSAHLN